MLKLPRACVSHRSRRDGCCALAADVVPPTITRESEAKVCVVVYALQRANACLDTLNCSWHWNGVENTTSQKGRTDGGLQHTTSQKWGAVLEMKVRTAKYIECLKCLLSLRVACALISRPVWCYVPVYVHAPTHGTGYSPATRSSPGLGKL